MVTFRVIAVSRSQGGGDSGWAVERVEPDGLAIMVSRLHATKKAAEYEASRLNEEASRRSMR